MSSIGHDSECICGVSNMSSDSICVGEGFQVCAESCAAHCKRKLNYIHFLFRQAYAKIHVNVS
jgi:hypothetical protein